MRLLGEAYNYRLVDSGVVFDTLYLLLSCGHTDAEVSQKLDPPNSFFRIRHARAGLIVARMLSFRLSR